MHGCGVVYVATGERFVEAARRSARSVRRNNPGLPIVLFSEAGVQPASEANADFDVVNPLESPHRRSKVDVLARSPFERTLYLDADICVYANLAEVFGTLDRFDIALAHAHARNRALTNQVWRTPIPESFPQLNGGVIAFRGTPEVRAFLTSWSEAFRAAGFRKDQVTLRELLWLSELRIATLPPEFNLRYLKYLWVWPRREARPRIMHLKAFAGAGAFARWLDGCLRWKLEGTHADHRDPQER